MRVIHFPAKLRFFKFRLHETMYGMTRDKTALTLVKLLKMDRLIDRLSNLTQAQTLSTLTISGNYADS